MGEVGAGKLRPVVPTARAEHSMRVLGQAREIVKGNFRRMLPRETLSDDDRANFDEILDGGKGEIEVSGKFVRAMRQADSNFSKRQTKILEITKTEPITDEDMVENDENTWAERLSDDPSKVVTGYKITTPWEEPFPNTELTFNVKKKEDGTKVFERWILERRSAPQLRLVK